MSGNAVCPTCGAPVGAGARFCATCGSPLGADLPEERKLATIVFADVTGSTDLGEQLDPERVRALLQEYFTAMASIVTTWGGTIEKYIGDAILAVWGVPAAREDDPIRALHAVREMIAELDRLNSSFQARHGVQLRVRIGVNTGEVLAPVGARPGGQFLVSGDPVNVASRLEQSAEPGTAIVGERTWSSARHAFEFGEPRALAIKGKREPVIARVLGEPLRADAQRTPFQGPMVGRDRELATVIGLLDEAIEGSSPRLVLITGPAGIGKSRLLRETISEAGERFDRLLVLRGRCLAAGHGITFWALGEILRAACSISLDEPAESAVAKLEQSVAGPLAAIGLGIEDIARTVAALATSANITLPDNLLEGLDPEAVFEEISRSWPRFLTGLARTWPLAIVIEDIHWADERMLTLIEMLAARSMGPILIVATARPEFLESHPGFGTGQDASVVSLRPLTGAQSERLIDELIGSAGLPERIVDDMRAKADGNPFFLEEMLQRLVDEGALVNEDGTWHATADAAAVKLSDNIHSLLAGRIDSLPMVEKQLLQEASVVGRIFWPGALGDVPAESRRSVSVPDVLHSLERRGLIAVRPTSTIDNEPEYMFRHVLIHDVAYGSVPKARRARAHADVGRWIETLAVDRRDEYEELVAYHYSAAILAEDADLAWTDAAEERESVRARAFEMLVSAGSSARHRFAVDKALQLHGEALELASGARELAVINEEIGDDHEALYRGDEGVAAYLAAIEHARQLQDGADRIPLIVAKAARMAIRWGTFRDVPPIDELQALINESLAQPVPDSVRAPLLIASAGLARGKNNIPIGAGRMLLSKDELPDLDERIADVEEGMRIAERIGDPSLEYMAFALLSILFQASEQEERYRQKCEEALSLIDKLPSRREQVDLLVSVAGARADAGRYEDSLIAGEDAFARSTDLSPHERMHAAWEIYRAAEPLGRWDRMLEILPWYAEAAAIEGEVTCAAVRAGPALGATVMARRGNAQRATELVPVVVNTARTSTFGGSAVSALYADALGNADANAIVDDALSRPSAGFIGTGIAPLLDTLVDLKRFDDLEAFLPFAISQGFANELAAPTIARAKAALALRRGDRHEAVNLLRSALARFYELSAPFQIAKTSELLADLVEEPERTQLLRAALDAYEDLGARPFADRIRSSVRGEVSASS